MRFRTEFLHLEELIVKPTKILKIAIASLLIIACALSMFGCKGKGSQHDTKTGKLPNQYENLRYYFQQGYRTDWCIKEVDSDKRMLDRETGLVMVLTPATAEEKTDENGKAKTVYTPIDGVEYCIYYYNGEGIMMTTSRSDIVTWLQDADSKFFFNNKHYRTSPRDTFFQVGEAVTTTAEFSKLQFSTISYTFTKDGEDYVGVYNLVMAGLEYFVVTFEAKEDLYAQYKDQYLETIGDFRRKGWETSDVG